MPLFKRRQCAPSPSLSLNDRYLVFVGIGTGAVRVGMRG